MANEAALQLARKYTHDRVGPHKSGIVAFRNAFHGRTLFTVTAGGYPACSQDFAPLPPGRFTLACERFLTGEIS